MSNREGYKDNTAERAIANVWKEQKKKKKRGVKTNGIKKSNKN